MKLTDLQGVVDNCGKNYPTLRKLKVPFSQMYEYAMKYEICMKDYSEYVDIINFKDKNPNKTDRSPFSKEEIDALWLQENNHYAQIVLMLIYSGVRVSELIGCSHKPHDTRHTCISMMTEKEVSPTLIKKIVGHSGAMSLTEKFYTRVNVQELLEAINKI